MQVQLNITWGQLEEQRLANQQKEREAKRKKKIRKYI